MANSQLLKLKSLIDQAKAATNQADTTKLLGQAADLMAVFLLPEAKQLVYAIEAKPETTKGHYGDYMHILSDCPDRLSTMAMCQALKQAGGDNQGINDALGILDYNIYSI